MARPVLEYIQFMYPRLYQDPARDIYIELATDRTSAAYFGVNLTNYAIALRAMHDFCLVTERKQGEAGFVTDRTEGRLSKRYLHNMTKSSKNDLDLTSYGQRLHAIIRARGPICGLAVTSYELPVNFPDEG